MQSRCIKLIIPIATAAILALAQPANAWVSHGGGGWHGGGGGWHGGGWGWGGAALGGAILGGVLAAPYYYGQPYYAAPYYNYGPSWHWDCVNAYSCGWVWRQ